jgi:hypothetical protein
MWDHTRSPEEMLPEQIIGLSEATGTTATPVVAPGSVADDIQLALEEHADALRKSIAWDLRRLALDPALIQMFGELAAVSAGPLTELDDDALFAKARSTSGPARDRWLRALANFVKNAIAEGRTLDELVEFAGGEVAEDLRAAAELVAT